MLVRWTESQRYLNTSALDSEEMKKTILGTFSEKGILLDPRAVDALTSLPNAAECADRIINDGENRPLVLTEEDVLRYALDGDGDACTAGEAMVQPEDPGRQTPQVERRVKVLKDITGNSTCVGNVIDFAKLFNDRYAAIKRMLSRRRDLAGLIPITKAKMLKRDLRFAGIVNDSRTTKNGHTMVELEDETDKIQVLVMKGSRRDGETYLKDEVLGVIGALSKDGEIVVAKDVVRPDIPLRNGMVPNGSDSIAAFVSDIHIGSNTFLEKEWRRFMDWLRTSAVAEYVRYIVMPGDLVDGIGIYPGQEDELEIDDLYDQYALLAETVKEFPDRVKLVMMPGNHDAVRLAEPQPALSGDIKALFDSNVQFVGNPCYMEIEGRTILAYHGKSMDDFNSSVRHLNYTNPQEAMKEMLRRRHLAPIYGGKTPLAPEQKDYMVIDRVPDIFVTGHVHVCRMDDYRGVRLINASAWQSQTSFQRMHNQIPDPARVPLVHLGTGECWAEDFTS